MRNWLARLQRTILRSGRRLKVTQIIVLVFLLIILLGAVLLSMPAASRTGERVGFLNALFTATSATCVTGLAVGDTYSLWSGFGQVVILCLIQLGGLGFMSILTCFFFLLRRRIGMRQRMLIAQALSLNDLEGVVKLVRHLVLGTLLFELSGALVLTIRFSFDVSFPIALKWGLFHAVSAFCNAGFDIFGQIAPGASIAPFATDFVVNAVLMVLIVVGGLGFFVWEDLLNLRKGGRLSVHAKLVLILSFGLILGGWLLFALLEWNNPDTLGQFGVGGKLLASLFQSVSTRTAGFASFDQGAMSDSSKLVTMILMFIGGSSGSTAGGVKTVTIGVLLLAVINAARGRNSVRIFRRTIRADQIAQAMAIVFLMLALALTGSIALSLLEGVSMIDASYEIVSALGTVGLTTGITPALHWASKLILIAYMFFGRVGILTISMGFLLRRRGDDRFEYAETRVLIG